ncbi:MULTISPECIES: hypothetical protein [Staphylococcus]|uniref:Uncharacterized protein n=1 Tax=Staphylococcus hsinchuensis TaxID=3051183 RepID=A0ABZ3EFT1_9STAP|nr:MULTISPECIES: hypothetical protein [unclassified Staphylococcus]
MIITMLLGAVTAICIAYNIFETEEKYGVVTYKKIILSVTYVIAAVIVGSFIDNIHFIFQGFHETLNNK